MKIKPCHLPAMSNKQHGNLLDQSNCFWITCKLICWRACQNGRETISPQRFSVFRPHLVRVMTAMIWGHLHNFSTVPPSCKEIWKMSFFTFNLWTVWPKITRLVPLHSEQHAGLNETQFPHVGHFGHWPFWIFTKIAVFYGYTGVWLQNVICLHHHALKIVKRFCDITKLWSKIIMKHKKTLWIFD